MNPSIQTAAELEKAIYKNYVELQFRKAHSFNPREYEKFRKYFHHNYSAKLPANKDAKIVDLGCGAGHFLYYLSSRGYTQFIGIDQSEACTVHCEKMGFKVKQLNFFQELREQKYDVIVANDVLEHLDRDAIALFLNLCRDALNPQGTLIIKVPNAANPITNGGLRYIDFTHRTSFTDASLDQLLRVYFPDTKIFGQKLFVFYANPLNYLGMMGQFFCDAVFKILAILYGQPEIKIYKKSLIAVSKKN